MSEELSYIKKDTYSEGYYNGWQAAKRKYKGGS